VLVWLERFDNEKNGNQFCFPRKHAKPGKRESTIFKVSGRQHKDAINKDPINNSSPDDAIDLFAAALL
jgi:hypothetical protein